MTYLIFGLVLVIVAVSSAYVGYLYRSYRHPDMMADIVAFHRKFDLEYFGLPRELPIDLADFRKKFMHEELDEYNNAGVELSALAGTGDFRHVTLEDAVDRLLELQLDALVDLTYVVLGTAYLQFGPHVFTEAWNRVHLKNMLKVRKLRATDGHTDSGRAAQYDVVKPAGWTPPSHLDLIQMRHRPDEFSHMTDGD